MLHSFFRSSIFSHARQRTGPGGGGGPGGGPAQDAAPLNVSVLRCRMQSVGTDVGLLPVCHHLRRAARAEQVRQLMSHQELLSYWL